jgi:hypothetical protein
MRRVTQELQEAPSPHRRPASEMGVSLQTQRKKKYWKNGDIEENEEGRETLRQRTVCLVDLSLPGKRTPLYEACGLGDFGPDILPDDRQTERIQDQQGDEDNPSKTRETRLEAHRSELSCGFRMTTPSQGDRARARQPELFSLLEPKPVA